MTDAADMLPDDDPPSDELTDIEARNMERLKTAKDFTDQRKEFEGRISELERKLDDLIAQLKEKGSI